MLICSVHATPIALVNTTNTNNAGKLIQLDEATSEEVLKKTIEAPEVASGNSNGFSKI